MYPEENWDFLQLKFAKGFWDSKENQAKFLLDVLKKEKLNSISELKHLQRKKIVSHGGFTLLSRYSSYFECLNTCKFLFIIFCFINILISIS